MYSRHITRREKGAVVFLIDQSGSMAEEINFQGESTSKARALASIANSLIEEFICRSQRERGVGDYFDIAVIGYGGEKATSLLGSGWRRIVDIDTMYVPSTTTRISRHLPDGQTYNYFVERREWITPTAKGRTPMGSALSMAKRLVNNWCKKHPKSFPPIVINITDGEASDSSPEELLRLALKLRDVATEDGNTLLFNIHIASPNECGAQPVQYPCENDPLPVHRFSQLLFEMSSPLPDIYTSAIREFKGTNSTSPARAMCFNTSCDELVGLMNIGTISVERML